MENNQINKHKSLYIIILDFIAFLTIAIKIYYGSDLRYTSYLLYYLITIVFPSLLIVMSDDTTLIDYIIPILSLIALIIFTIITLI